MEHRAIATAAVDAFNRHDAASIGALYAESGTLADPQYEQPLSGRAAIQADFEQLFAAFPDVALELIHVVADSGGVAYEVVMRGTNTGPMETPQGRYHRPGVPSKFVPVTSCRSMSAGWCTPTGATTTSPAS